MDLTRPLPRFDFYDEDTAHLHLPRLPARLEDPRRRRRAHHPLRGQHRQPLAHPRRDRRHPDAHRRELPDRAGRRHGRGLLRIPGRDRPEPRPGRPGHRHRPRLRDPRRHRRQERPDRPRRPARQPERRGRRDRRQPRHRRRHRRRPQGCRHPRRHRHLTA
ncbi:MAG: hypothetical protein M0C28_01005 [Candidatus Moduliflexus flocculans]|nr:hypothetical protein [Candidatus Moduliflexus flocculans]